MPFDTNLRNTCIFLAVFILAFFPNAFHYAVKPFLAPLDALFGNGLSISPPLLPICRCCPPANCPGQSPPAQRQSIMSTWFQKQITLPSRARGSYLITDTITKELPEIQQYKVGILHLFLQHTSAALSLNENWDSEVREDMTDALERIVPYDKKGDLYRHSCEGPDDMPAHVKSALIGASISVPIANGKLATGTWQGIWYLEFRAAKHTRRVMATIQGEKA